jgi:phage baseplate assembly protein W
MSNLLSDFNSTDRINSNVARTRLYSDLNLGFVINPITKDVSPLTDIDAVKNSLKNLMLTNFHDRPFNPTLGSGLTALLFEPANVFTAMALKDAIQKVINNHEPRVTDVMVQIVDNSDMNEYRVTVSFRVFYDDTTNEIEFFLTRLR